MVTLLQFVIIGLTIVSLFAFGRIQAPPPENKDLVLFIFGTFCMFLLGTSWLPNKAAHNCLHLSNSTELTQCVHYDY